MKINFSKMHGIGNDYIYVNCLDNMLEKPEEIAVLVSDRRFGIGGDGLILICPSDIADFRMRMFNADGSEGNMCGNGTRCIGKYVYDNKLTNKREITLETLGGIKTLKLFPEGDIVNYLEVNMGKALLSAKDIPVKTDLENFINQPFIVAGKEVFGTCVSMGNPHLVIFTTNIDQLDLDKIGPAYENHKLFPHRINTEFIEILDEKTIKMRVWERGSGETLACGTGACATVVAAVLNGKVQQGEEITVKLRGGDLKITYQKDESVLMKGTATHVFDGILEV